MRGPAERPPSSSTPSWSRTRAGRLLRGGPEEHLPEEERRHLRAAVRLESVNVVLELLVVVMVAAVSGQSQAMKVSWMEDLLSMVPSLSFLIASRRIRRAADADYPYGHHRSIGVAHLVGASALLMLGAYLLFDSVSSLLAGERPPIGLVVVLGHPLWAGWLMIGAMVVGSIPPVIVARFEKRLAEQLHDKVLYADAAMNKANWSTSLATVVGVLGIGVGWWWADAAAAALISLSIVRDGAQNLSHAVAGLSDKRAYTFDDSDIHPLIDLVQEEARSCPWVEASRARVRDEGHVFHAEVFVVPRDGTTLRAEDFAQLVEKIRGLDWKLNDVVVAPVPNLPHYQADPQEKA